MRSHIEILRSVRLPTITGANIYHHPHWDNFMLGASKGRVKTLRQPGCFPLIRHPSASTGVTLTKKARTLPYSKATRALFLDKGCPSRAHHAERARFTAFSAWR